MRKSFTFGVLPSQDEFTAAFSEICPEGSFAFGNDKRVGSCSLSVKELWQEVYQATQEWETGKAIRNKVHVDLSEEGVINAGIWASMVLNSLGFKWI